MTFEKQFPSLIQRVVEQTSDNIPLFDAMTEEDLIATCLDKQRVREAFETVRLEEGVELNCGGVLDEILERLGL